MLLSRSLVRLVALSATVSVTLPGQAQPTAPGGPPDDPTGSAAAGDEQPGPTAAPAVGDPQEPEAGDEPKAAPSPEEDEDDIEPEPPLLKPAPDTLAGHIMLGVSAVWAIPFGYVEDELAQTDVLSAGPGAAVDLAFGVSRTVAVGAWGQYLSLGAPDDCSDCSATSMAGGLFVRYHIVQGMAFDPWMSAGLGYRITSIDGGSQTVDYSGIEWLRLQVGGDWYPLANVGFGPYMELDMGRYSSRSEGDFGGQANHWQFIVGARVSFDIPGK